MGGRVKLMITGSAPLAENVLTFVRAAMGCIVVEGYGQTECVAACTVSMEGDSLPGHVGMPSPCVAIKLVDVPELGYFAKDEAGEVREGERQTERKGVIAGVCPWSYHLQGILQE